MGAKQRILMKPGQMVGFLKLVKKVRAPRNTSPSIKKRWLCVCTAEGCGTKLVVPEMYLRRPNNPRTHCGCQTKTPKTIYNNEYRIWLMVRKRTRDPSHTAYKSYSSKGIDICDEWYDLETGFDKFFAEVGPRTSKDHSLDRIDNTRGYEPGNVRWATASEQRANQGDVVAGYSESEIILAGYSREEFTQLIAEGADAQKLIEEEEE